MPIPITPTPKFSVKLPSTGQQIEYRPFVVKEEKVLLFAAETKDQAQIMSAVKDTIAACTFQKLDVENLPMFDIEYLFLQIRSKSIGETATPNIKCSKCEALTAVPVDLSKVQVSDMPESMNIMVTDEIGVIMRFPSYALIGSIDGLDKQDSVFELAAACIDKIYDTTTVYDSKDFERKDMVEFIENMTQSAFIKMTSWFDKMPRVKHDISFECKSCKHKNEMTLAGLADFFT